jgi:hypothetical protein
MRYSLECKVDSRLAIGSVIDIVENTKEYVFTPDKEGMLASLKIIKKVDDPEKFYSKIEEGDEKVRMKITVETDEAIFRDLRSDFQYIESYLAFIGNLEKIHWEVAKQEWIPETPEEKSRLKVFEVSLNRTYPDTPTPIVKDVLIVVVRGKNKYDGLTTLKSFYREGKNLFTQFRYVDAFYYFYFVIEDLHGGGKTKNVDIERNFRSSKELRETVEWVMQTQINTSEKHSKSILLLLAEEKIQNGIDGIIELIVAVRGRLHHYISRSSLKQATPLNQRDFESPAFLVMGIALMSILKEIVKINQKHERKSAT